MGAFSTDTGKQRDRFRNVMVFMAASAAVIAYMSAVFGLNVDKSYYKGFWAVVVPLAGLAWAYSNYRHLGRILMVRGTWGRFVKRKRDMEDIRRLHGIDDGNGLDTEPDATVMDDRTWNDMGMDGLFTQMDRTLTTPGAQVLYRMLRRPILSVSALRERDAAIEALRSDESARERLQLLLADLGHDDKGDIMGLLYGHPLKPNRLMPLYTALAVAAVLALIAIPLNKAVGSLAVLAVYAVNSYLHYRLGAAISANVASIGYMCSLISTAARVGGLDLGPGMEPRLAELRVLAGRTQPLANKAGGLNARLTGDLGIVYEYVKLYFLTDIRRYTASIRAMEGIRPELRAVFEELGEIDALLSVASYRAGAEGEWCKPDLDAKGGNGIRVTGINMRHPLMDECVPNSIDLGRPGILITGSNMAGKSTFLRVLGLNAILAQTVYTCPAQAYTGTPVRIMSSLTRSDDLGSGKSYYLTEAEALLNMVRAAEGDIPCLLLVDEILNGTNSVERIAASKEIMAYLASHNAITVVSTHDLRLTELVGGIYGQYHFSEGMSGEGLVFDYTLKEGVSTSRNAIRLMEYLGYPGGITDKAEASVNELLGNG